MKKLMVIVMLVLCISAAFGQEDESKVTFFSEESEVCTIENDKYSQCVTVRNDTRIVLTSGAVVIHDQDSKTTFFVVKKLNEEDALYLKCESTAGVEAVIVLRYERQSLEFIIGDHSFEYFLLDSYIR